MRTTRRLLRRVMSDRGSAAPALELVLITPMIVLIVLVGVAAGRTATGDSRAQQAAAAAARAASLEHTTAAAESAARTVAAESLRGQGIDCRAMTITLDTAGYATPPGTPAHVAVTVNCTVSYAGLGIPGWPGTHTVAATAASPLDMRAERP